MTRSPGRPAIGPTITIRLPLAQIEWLDEQRGKASRAEEIRRLIDQAAQRPGITRQQIWDVIAVELDITGTADSLTDAVWALLADGTTPAGECSWVDAGGVCSLPSVGMWRASVSGPARDKHRPFCEAHGVLMRHNHSWQPAGTTPTPEEER